MLTLSDIKNKAPNAHDATQGGRGEKAATTDGSHSLTLHGPPGLSEFYRATRHFIRRDDFRVGVEAVRVSVFCLLPRVALRLLCVCVFCDTKLALFL